MNWVTMIKRELYYKSGKVTVYKWRSGLYSIYINHKLLMPKCTLLTAVWYLQCEFPEDGWGGKGEQ